MKEQLLSTDWFLSDLKVLSLSHSFGKSSVNLKKQMYRWSRPNVQGICLRINALILRKGIRSSVDIILKR